MSLREKDPALEWQKGYDQGRAAILAELETPSVEMVEAGCEAYDDNAPGHAHFAGVAAALQAIAAHLRTR